MSVNEYADYTRDRVGWFFGMTGPQLATVTVAGVPVLLMMGAQRWLVAAAVAAGWAIVLTLVVLPVHGRSATQWFGALVVHTVGRGAGWSAFRSKVSVGEPAAPDDADLPGILSAVQVHDGPPRGARMTRVAMIQDHTAQTWAATARIVHPGIGTEEARERNRMGEGLAQLLEVLARTELVRMLVLQVRTVPDDGAERAQWVAANQRPGAPALSRKINDDLAVTLTAAAVRTEAFVTVVAAESALAKPARAVRRRPGRPSPGAVRAAGRGGGPPARGGGLLERGVAGLAGAGRCGANWVRSGGPGRPRCCRRRAVRTAGCGDDGAVGGGRTRLGGCTDPLVRARRLAVGQRHHRPARPGRNPGGAGAGAGPGDSRGAAVVHGLLPRGCRP